MRLPEPPAALHEALGPILFSEARIQARVAELGEAISGRYAGQDLVLAGVLTGVVPFVADLLRALSIPVEVDFLSISRFGPSAETHGAVRLVKDLDLPVEGRHVLLVDNIIDTGFTLNYLLRVLRLRSAASLGVCVLLDRRQRRLVEVPLDFCGFEAPDEFVVGYGLHFRQQYRQLPYIARFDWSEAEG